MNLADHLRATVLAVTERFYNGQQDRPDLDEKSLEVARALRFDIATAVHDEVVRLQATVTEDQLHAAMDAFYPGENWRVDLKEALPNAIRDMRAALEAAATSLTDLSITCNFCISLTGKRDPNRYCGACNPGSRPAKNVEEPAAPKAGEVFTRRLLGRTVLEIAALVEQRVTEGKTPGANFPAEWLPFLVEGLRAALAAAPKADRS